METSCPSVDPPFLGDWKAVHNPGDSPHAMDFVGLRPGTRLPYPPRALVSHLFYRAPATTAFGWNRPVYAPFDGEVIEARDGYPDTIEINLVRDLLRNVVRPPRLDGNIQRFAGNYVVIEAAACVAFLAHLRCTSVAVAPGDDVAAGERIGVVGNAGASLLPHLHFQVLSEWPADVSAIGERDIPFRFRRYDRRVDGAWRTARNRRPASGERIRVRTRTDG